MSVRKLLIVWLFLYGPLARAELTIEITQGRDEAASIAVVPFRWQVQGNLDASLTGIVAADLKRSGQFRPLPVSDMLATPHQKSEVHYRDWRLSGVDYLLIGRVQQDIAAGQLRVQFELFDVLRESRILFERVNSAETQLRDVAHYISDKVYENLTGVKGAFSTKILYVAANNFRDGSQRFRLIKADADGERELVVLDSTEPVLSPSWSPDGKQVAYVSFEDQRPGIYRQVVASGEREKLTGFPGLNSAPAWSPDGSRLALVLSRDGNPEIYVMELKTGELRRLTQHFGIDTEPDWMPDGKSLVFTSNRGGKPQIYRLELSSGQIQRLTFEGDYNARAKAMADGSGIIFVHREESTGPFQIALKLFDREQIRVLSETLNDESPTLAPNGSMVLYATKRRGQGILAVVSVDTSVKYILPSATSDVREPAWGPFNH